MKPLSIKPGSRISIINTGGTIATALQQDGSLNVGNSGSLHLSNTLSPVIQKAREQFNLQVKISSPLSLLSENMLPSDWCRIAEAIKYEWQQSSGQLDGIVITHGTDTLAYSSSALSFMLKSLPIPVVFTAANISPSLPNSDAASNLWHSILLAASNVPANVFAVFSSPTYDADVYLGSQFSSISSHSQFFSAIPSGPVGFMSENAINIKLAMLPKRPEASQLVINTQIDPAVKIIPIFPGLHSNDIIKLADEHCRAIILNLYHSGTACIREDTSGSDYSLLPAIQHCASNNILVLGLPFEPLTDKKPVYTTTKTLFEAGLTPLPLIPLEAAYTKIICLLGRHESNDKILMEMTKHDHE